MNKEREIRISGWTAVTVASFVIVVWSVGLVALVGAAIDSPVLGLIMVSALFVYALTVKFIEWLSR